MPVDFHNFDYTYTRKGKPVFVPTPFGAKIGYDIKNQVEAAVTFDPIYYHLQKGGHVAALHAHRSHQFFARIDIERFFYSVSKSVVQRALSSSGIIRARFYAKWSCVKNPYEIPRYALPYGFVQSPILATLVLMTSAIGQFLRTLDPDVTASVYMDDISLSSDNIDLLEVAFEGLHAAIATANFTTSAEKTRKPARAIDLFNCDLTLGRTLVTNERIDAFYAGNPMPLSAEAFDIYCSTVSAGNF